MGSLWVTIACLAAAYWGFHRLLAWRHLSHVPGPASAAWSDLWLIRRTWSGDLFHELGEVSARYGAYIYKIPDTRNSTPQLQRSEIAQELTRASLQAP